MHAARVPRGRSGRRRGAVVVLVAITGTVLIGVVALTVDAGNMYMVRTELQRTADAAALAAAGKLVKYEAGVSEAAAFAEAQRIVEANPVQGVGLKLESGCDVTFGKAVWNALDNRYTYQVAAGVPTAVRVHVRKTEGSLNGPVQMLFASIFGMGEADMSARAAAMIVPRDISVVADLSGSMNDDSELQHYQRTAINLYDVWRSIPIEYGNNGVGNGIDPQPPGNPPPNDLPGTGPGNPGARKGDHTRTISPDGPTWGRMSQYGTVFLDSSYSPAADPGLLYLPYGQHWSNDTETLTWLQMVGYSNDERQTLISATNDAIGSYKYRTAVALGLARWDSGRAGGLWSTLPPSRTSGTLGNGDSIITGNEIAWLVPYPFQQGSWIEYIDSYMRDAGTAMAQANFAFRYRYGVKTLVNYHLEIRRGYSETEALWRTPEEPLEAVRLAVATLADTLEDLQAQDKLSLEMYAETCHHVADLTTDYHYVSAQTYLLQAGHFDGWTNMGGGLHLAIQELFSARGRNNAAKVILLLTDGQPNVAENGDAPDNVGGYAWAIKKAAEAVARNIQIYCVSVGTGADRELMKRIAAMGGGEEFYADGSIAQYSAELQRILTDLGSRRPVRLIE